MKIGKILPFSLAILLLSVGCEEPVTDNSEEGTFLQDTRGQDLSGDQDNLQNYFFAIGDNINIKYDRVNSYNVPDTLNLKSFPEYYLVFEPDDPALTQRTLGEPYLDLDQNGTLSDDEEFVDWDGDGEWDTVDTTIVNNTIIQSWLVGNPIDSLIWNIDNLFADSLQRYKKINPSMVFDTTFEHIDTVIFIHYHANFLDTIDSNVETVFLDTLEWQEDTLEFSAGKFEIKVEKEFENYKELNSDRLMYRENTDCDNDGELDSAETLIEGAVSLSQCQDANGNWDDDINVCFIDTGNGLWDRAEPYVESSWNESNNAPFDYLDLNCNRTWDDAEQRVSDSSECNENEEYLEDGLGGFCDKSNGRWDDQETSEDLDGSGDISNDEIFKWLSGPMTLLVTYRDDSIEDDLVCDPDNPIPLTVIKPAIADSTGWESVEDSLKYHFNYNTMIDRWCNIYDPIINVYTMLDTFIKSIDDVDSILTIYSNEVIHSFDSTIAGSEYLVTKTHWSDGYDYILFEDNIGDINKLAYPSYFNLPGYNPYADSIDTESWIDGLGETSADYNVFWHEENPQIETVFYASNNGKIRDGEVIETDTTIYTISGTYRIEKLYEVLSDTLTVPLLISTSFCSDTEFDSEEACNAAGFDWVIEEDETYFGGDSTYRVTRTLKMTLIGPDLEYGEKNISWLVRGYGIVKDELYFRWSEPSWQGIGEEGFYDNMPGAWVGDEYWGIISKLELAEFRQNDAGDGGFLARLFGGSQLNINSFSQMEEFNNEPFKITRTSGIQRVEFKGNE